MTVQVIEHWLEEGHTWTVSRLSPWFAWLCGLTVNDSINDSNPNPIALE